jgi:hypothetical protein
MASWFAERPCRHDEHGDSDLSSVTVLAGPLKMRRRAYWWYMLATAARRDLLNGQAERWRRSGSFWGFIKPDALEKYEQYLSATSMLGRSAAGWYRTFA